MSYTKCQYYHCNKTSRDITMFRFPVNDPERLKLWIRNSGNLFLESLRKEILSHRFICADHFRSISIHRGWERTRLIGPAVPVHFQHPILPQVHVTHQLKVLKPLKVYAGRKDGEKSEKKNYSTTKKIVEEPQKQLSLVQCSFCGEYPEDFVAVTSEKPYLVNNRTSITLNGLTVDLNFMVPKSVCRYCDGKLQELHDFVKQVKEAQDTLINVTEKIETVIVKTESTLEDTVEGTVEVDSVTGETDYVKLTVYTHRNKRKNDSEIDVKKQKQKVMKDVAKKRRVAISENSESIFDIKEEAIDDDSGAEMENSRDRRTRERREVSDTGTTAQLSPRLLVPRQNTTRPLLIRTVRRRRAASSRARSEVAASCARGADVKPSDKGLKFSDLFKVNDMIYQTFS